MHKVLVSFQMDLREEGGNKGTVCKIFEALHHHMSIHQKSSVDDREHQQVKRFKNRPRCLHAECDTFGPGEFPESLVVHPKPHVLGLEAVWKGIGSDHVICIRRCYSMRLNLDIA